MSMLAGPKRKKQYVLNPRGKPLYNDDDRFGSKMLQKMGWTKGKGLGAKEHGSVDFVRVNFKCDAAGLGFEDRDDQWTQHEKGFNGFLETLHAGRGSNEDSSSKSSEDEEMGTVGFGFKKTETKKSKPKKLTENISGQSLEERSKQSRARVHYKKYTRGKDLAQYSEKDLANIFGKKVNEIGGEEEEEDKSSASGDSGTAEAKVIEEKAKAENEEGEEMLKTSVTSIDDYFRLKMQQKKTAAMQKKGNDSGELIPLEEKEENRGNAKVAESESKQKKHKSRRDDQHVLNEITEAPENTEVSEKKKKKRKSSIDAAAKDNQTETPEIKNKKKKRKSSMEDLIESASRTEEIASVEQQPSTVDKSASETIAASEGENKKKKKKRKSSMENLIDTASKTEETLKISKSSESAALLEEEGKKKKKKRKSSMEELIAENNLAANTPTQQEVVNSNESEVKKKNKKQKINNDEPTIALDIETPIENNTTANKNIEENVRFSKRKTITDPKGIRNTKEFKHFYCTYQISSFVAEKFRHLDFKKFRNSNLAQLIGYGQDESLKIEIIPKDNDEYRILELWKHSLDKYSDRKLMREEHKSNATKKSENTKTDDPEQTTKTTATTKATKQNQQKSKKFKSNLTKLKSLKRRSVFKLGI